MSRITDRLELGYFPLQDQSGEAGGRELSSRQSLGGVRISKIPEPDQSNTARGALIEVAREKGLGTVGDIHPWAFWQTRGREQRGSGSWAQAFAALVVDADSHYLSMAAQPIRGEGWVSDARYDRKDLATAEGLPRYAAGSLVAVFPGTDEQDQYDLPVWVDPRLVAPHTEGPGECGTVVVDIQPAGELCMDGSDTPGVGGRQARLQTIFRVIAVPEGGSFAGLGGEGNVLALNYSKTGLEGTPGYGAVFAPLLGGGPTTGGGGRDAAPGNDGPHGQRGGHPPGSTLNGFDPFGGPLTGFTGDEKEPRGFGQFRRKTIGGHGVALMSAVGGYGPLHAGSEADKHRFGVDADGHPINAGHISTGAFFFMSGGQDAPLAFEQASYPNPPSYPLKSKTHLSYDPVAFHAFHGGPRLGLWKWWTEVPYYGPTTQPPTEPPPHLPPPPPPDPGGPTTPGPGGPGTPGPPTPGGPGGGPGTGGKPPPKPPGGPTTPGPGGGGPLRPPLVKPGPPPLYPLPPGLTQPLPPLGPGTGGGGGKSYPGGEGGVGPIDPPPDGPTTGLCNERRRSVLGNDPNSTGQNFFLAGQNSAQQRADGMGQRRQLQSNRGGGGGMGGSAANDPRSGMGRWSGRNPWTLEPERVPGLVESVGAVTERSLGLYGIFHPLHESFAAVSFRPQLWVNGYPNFERNPQLHAGMIEQEELSRPHVLTMRAWGAQSTDAGEWDYVERPAESRARGGTVSGGVMFAPPRFEAEDYFDIGRETDVESTTGAQATTAYVLATPGVAFALGLPSTGGGLSAGGITIAQEVTTRALLVEQDSVELIRAIYDGTDAIVELGQGGTGAIIIPQGTSGDRPSSPLAGMLRVRWTGISADVLEFYDSTSAAWVDVTPTGTAPLLEVADGGTGATTEIGAVENLWLDSVWEHFLSLDKSQDWTLSKGATGGDSYIVPIHNKTWMRTTDAQGVLMTTNTTGTTSSDGALLNATDNTGYLADGVVWYFRVAINNNASCLYRFGLTATSHGAVSDVASGAYFEYDSANSYIYGCTASASAGSQDKSSTGVAPSVFTQAWRMFALKMTASGVEFYDVDDDPTTPVLTLNGSNLPTAGAERLAKPFFQSVGNGATYRELYCDAWGVQVGFDWRVGRVA